VQDIQDIGGIQDIQLQPAYRYEVKDIVSITIDALATFFASIGYYIFIIILMIILFIISLLIMSMVKVIKKV
jgi:hypothetical protein